MPLSDMSSVNGMKVAVETREAKHGDDLAAERQSDTK